MTRSVLEDAFGHHAWATLRLIEVCASLESSQLATTVPGTFGSILETLRHTVGADASYLNLLSGGQRPPVDDEGLDVVQLSAEMEINARLWPTVIAGELDPDQVVVRHRDDGSESSAPLGIRIAQVIHHGTDHRSQICTALTTLGITPPEIDVWDWASEGGRLHETPPTTA